MFLYIRVPSAFWSKYGLHLLSYLRCDWYGDMGCAFEAIEDLLYLLCSMIGDDDYID